MTDGIYFLTYRQAPEALTVVIAHTADAHSDMGNINFHTPLCIFTALACET